ncbi:type IV secretory system conjugative DNA transfer family protein [candidate division KSB1 bacterium]|nr:type IV secretory system conjugative DNA transfer family protein [candidate division KSB1 bacterium]
MHVIGLTGAGKSFFLELMMRQFLVAKKGFCLIDPLGYLYESMVNVVAHRPEFADRVIFFNPSKPTDYIAGYNPFQYDKSQGSLIAKRNTIAELLLQVFKTDPAIAQRLELVMRRAIHPLIEAGLTACELSYFFHDDAKIRNLILSRCSSAEVLDSWARIDQLPARMREEKLGSFENRVSKLTELEMIRATLGQTANTFSIPEVVEENKILLVNLSESEWLSGSDANVIGTMLVNDMHQYALRRSKEDAENNPFYLVMDEFHNFLTAKAENILDQCRQKGVHMILAHQRLNQLVSEHLNPKNAILEAVKSCARTKVIFSLYPDDADVFARYFAPELPEKEVKNEIYRTTVLNYSIEREIVHGRSRGESEGLARSSGSAGGSGSASGSGFTSGNTHNVSHGFDQDGNSLGHSSGFSYSNAQSFSEMNNAYESWSDSEGYSSGSIDMESEQEVMMLIPELGQELASQEFWSLDDQLKRMGSRLVGLPNQFAYIKYGSKKSALVKIKTIFPVEYDEEKILKVYELSARANPELYLPFKQRLLQWESNLIKLEQLDAPEKQKQQILPGGEASGDIIDLPDEDLI